MVCSPQLIIVFRTTVEQDILDGHHILDALMPKSLDLFPVSFKTNCVQLCN